MFESLVKMFVTTDGIIDLIDTSIKNNFKELAIKNHCNTERMVCVIQKKNEYKPYIYDAQNSSRKLKQFEKIIELFIDENGLNAIKMMKKGDLVESAQSRIIEVFEHSHIESFYIILKEDALFFYYIENSELKTFELYDNIRPFIEDALS